MYSIIKKDKLETKELETLIKRGDEFLLFDTQRKDSENYFSYLFYNPIHTIECFTLEKMDSTLKEIDKIIEDGYWVAGYFNYEAGEALVDGYIHTIDKEIPLFRFGVYEKPIRFESLEENHTAQNFQLSEFETSLNKKEYLQGFSQVLEWIEKGEVYQVNYTMELNFYFQGNLLDLYTALRKLQNTSYSALSYQKGKSILSLSPELFFKKVDKVIFSRPMKGTFQNSLSKSEESKNRAENFMIADLIRNDLGKICKLGTVEVKDKLKQENYQTLSQLTTKIEGIPKEYLQPSEIIYALFPSGSVTGAPKKSAMEKIYQLEGRRRGIYTGSLGFFSPERDGVFNVAIRTIELKEDSGKMGIGSGLVWDSIGEKEWEECLQKSFFLLKATDFSVFESILSAKGKFHFLQEHLHRLKNTCAFFQIPIVMANLERKIREAEKKLPIEKMKWKLEIDIKGNINFTGQNLGIYPKKGKVDFSKSRTNSRWVFLGHKTSERKLYNNEFLNAQNSGLLDFIFLNEKEEVTEGCISNIFVKIGNQFFTPPLESGVLSGVFRNYLLKKFPRWFQEKTLHKEDVLNAEKIFLCNSVRGILKVTKD